MTGTSQTRKIRRRKAFVLRQTLYVLLTYWLQAAAYLAAGFFDLASYEYSAPIRFLVMGTATQLVFYTLIRLHPKPSVDFFNRHFVAQFLIAECFLAYATFFLMEIRVAILIMALGAAGFLTASGSFRLGIVLTVLTAVIYSSVSYYVIIQLGQPGVVQMEVFYAAIFAACGIVHSLLAGLFRRQRAELSSLNKQLSEERQKAEGLLLNILPEPIAKRLRKKSQLIADSFDEVTVLFADIADFTPMSAQLQPQEVVGLLNRIFSEFDLLVDKYGLEKIKTIGDEYMAAAGVPVPRVDHAEAAAFMALEMNRVVAKISSPSGVAVSMRIGISSGPVVAGVIGTKKFAYDLWGDTVNTASRMESQGEPMAIHVTASTYERLKDRFDFTARGTIDVKGKGAMKTWWLVGERSPAHNVERP